MPAGSGTWIETGALGLEVLVHQLDHLEHVDHRLAAEDRLEVVVGLDVPPVLRILQLVLLDVRPELLGDFRARNGLAADDFRERRARGHRLHERRIRLARGLLRRLLCHLCSLFSRGGFAPPDPPTRSLARAPSPIRFAWLTRYRSCASVRAFT